MGIGPVEFDVEGVEPSFEESEEVLEEVEGVGLNLPFLVVHQNLPGNAHLEALLAVEPEDVEDEDEGAHQPSHIGQKGVYFVEGPFYFGTFGGLEQDNLGEVDSRGGVGAGVEGALGPGDVLSVPVFPGHDALVGLDHIFLDVAVAVAAKCGVEQKYILVFDIKLLVGGIAGVDQSVDHGKQHLKLAKGRLYSCKGRVVETRAINRTIAPRDCYSQLG